jgi:hypothetical protein
MGFARMCRVADLTVAAALFLSASLAIAQEPKAGSQRAQATEAEISKRLEEMTEAAKQLSGPAGQPECVWAGRLAVHLLIKNDIDTAFRHMELYDRFGCPPSHIQAAFRCLVRQGLSDLKASEWPRTHACWINPTPEITNAPAAAAAPAPTTNR